MNIKGFIKLVIQELLFLYPFLKRDVMNIDTWGYKPRYTISERSY